MSGSTLYTVQSYSFFGSSGISGKGVSDLEEEVRFVAEAVGDAFDDLDLVVDAFQQARADLGLVCNGTISVIGALGALIAGLGKFMKKIL